jgi:hypothetical protein
MRRTRTLWPPIVAVATALVVGVIWMFWPPTTRNSAGGAATPAQPPSRSLQPLGARTGVSPPISVSPGVTANFELSWAGQKLPPSVRELADQNPIAALELAVKDQTATKSDVLLRSVASYLLLKDFTLAPKIVSYLKEAPQRQGVLMSTVMHALRKDKEATLQTIPSIVGAGKVEAFRISVSALVQLGDVQSAKRVQMEMPFSRERDLAIATLAPHMAKAGTEEAFAWLSQLQPQGERSQAMQEMLRTFMAAQSEENVLRLLPYANNDVLRGHILQAAVKLRQDRGDSAGVDQLLEKLSVPQADSIRSAVMDLRQPLNEYLHDINQLKTPSVRTTAVERYFATNTANDPKSWAEQAIALEDELSPSALRGVIKNWMRIDSEELSEWVQRLPAGPRRDQTIRDFAMQMSAIDLEAAKAAAHWITDPTLRNQTVKILASRVPGGNR